MWLLLPFCLGLLVPVHGNQFRELDKIVPKTNFCIILLIMCDDYKLPLTPVENTYYEFYTDAKSLQKSCRKNERFIRCARESIKVCNMLPQTRETVRLIETRGFPEIFCKPGSPWQRLYLENAECVNSFAAAAEDVCGYKAMDLVRATPTTEVRQFCRSSIAVRECFVRMIRKACGIIAGDLIKRVVVYGRGDDFVCNKLEKETEDILQKFWFSPATNYNLNSDQTTRLFLTDLKSVRKLPMSITTPSPNANFGAMHHDHPIAIEIPVTTKIPQFTGYLEDETDYATTLNFEDSNVPEESYFTVTLPFDTETDQSSDEYSTRIPILRNISDSYTGQTDTYAMFPPDGEDSNVPEEPQFTETSPFDAETDQSSDEYSTTQIPITTVFTDSYTGQTVDTSAMFPPYGMYAYTNFTSFGLYEIMDNGDAFYLGCGTATVQWATDRKLKNVLCGWVHAEATNALFKCNIHLDEACIFEDYENSKNQEINLALRKILLVVFNLEKGTYREMATMKLRHFKPEDKPFTPTVDYLHSERADAEGKNRRRTKRVRSFTEL